jgi:hypothetical protein
VRRRLDRARYPAAFLLEGSDEIKVHSATTGQGCTIIPAAFYPYFSTVTSGANCRWGIGSTPPGTISDFGKNAQYGQLLPLTYTNGHGTVSIIEDYRNILNTVSC